MNAPTNPVLHVPAHKQTNSAAKPGQIVNHCDAITASAADMFDVAPHEVTPEQRRYAKTVGFAKMYGSSSSLGTLPALAAAFVKEQAK